MKTFIVEDSFWSIFPQAKIGVVVCNGIDNRIRNVKVFQDMLLEAEKEALNHLTLENITSDPVISVWREAYKTFKTKKGARSSIESLLKRVVNGNHICNINSLVDIYNSISLKYALPCGGEDIDTIVGDLRLTKAKGDESFIALGSNKNEPPYEGELIYKDDIGAICRCLNWREASRTMLTEKTKNVFLCIELIDESRYMVFENALKDLSQKISKNLGGTNRIEILNNENPQIAI